MQKDFHYDVVYALAQLTGFNQEEAYKIAYSSQYVDDAIHYGIIKFMNGAMYARISSAHSNFDLYNNTNIIKNQFVWVPFHFLPGNCNLPREQGNDRDYVDRLICYANSYISREMVVTCLKQKGTLSALHRLGITLHVYADTWAHQGFAGIITDKNRIQNLNYTDTSTGIIKFHQDIIKEMEDVLHQSINYYLPLGHAAALSYPDLPYLNEWSFDYQDDRGTVNRNNTEIFIEAADHIYKILQLFKQGIIPDDLETMFDIVVGLSEEKKEYLARAFQNFTGNTEQRHENWIREINSNSFSGVQEIPAYHDTGENSWKSLALGSDFWEQTIEYPQDFINSDWKLFHDALQLHRTYILNELLPKYNICAI